MIRGAVPAVLEMVRLKRTMVLKLKGMSRPSPGQAKVIVCLSGALIAAVDFSLPDNINIATFYFLAIVLAGWTRSLKWLWACTVIFVLLTFGGITFALAPIVNAVTWVDWLNRTMIAVALAVVAVPVHLRLRNLVAQERTIADLNRAERALEESYAQLEDRVKERTQALTAINERLQREIATRIAAETNLRKSEASLRRLSVEVLQAQDEERRHIGQELHDGLGQCLAGLKLSLHFLDAAIPPAEESARQHYSDCLDITEDAISQVRTLSHLMYPPLLEQMGLQSAIPWYVRGFEQRSGIQATLDMPEHLQRLPREVEITLFRILQESLTNIHRHSGSRNAQVVLQITNDSVVLKVKDSGKGIGQRSPGVGLRSMQERAKQLTGKLEISSGSQGTTVTATLPLPEHSASVGAS